MVEHGVNRGVVRGARERAGAPKHPRGRRRGATIAVTTVKPATEQTAVQRVLSRAIREARGPSMTEPAITGRVASRTVAYQEAKTAGDRLAKLDAAVSAASAWILLVDHLLKLEAA